MSASDKKKLRKENEFAALTEKQQAQQKKDNQLKNETTIFVVVMALVIAIAVTSMGVSWYNTSGIPARGTVALTVGNAELSNADLNYYYMDTINNFYGDVYDQYGEYASMYVSLYMGLDLSKPLSSQTYNEATGDTWADYFIDSAISSATSTYALYNAAMSNGDYKLPEDFETELNAALASTKAMAGYYGFDSMEAYLKAMYGNGANEETYVNYYRVNAIAEAYYVEYYNGLEYTKDQIDAYNNEHYNDFSSFEYSYYYVPVSKYLPTTTDGVEITAEQRADAVAAAKAAADGIALCSNLEVFNRLIQQLPFATESTAAEEIDNTTIGSVATLYSEWIGDRARVAGETSVFEYESTSDKDEDVDGYYVVLFEGRKDYNTLLRSARHILVAFEGGTKDANGNITYSQAEKDKAKDEADKLYNEWLNGGDLSSEAFAAKVTNKTSDDTGSNTTGGLYENIYQGQMVTNFDKWVFDGARVPGDHGVIETEYGYHIMFYVGEQENTYREYMIEMKLCSLAVEEWYNGLVDNVTATEGDTSYINKAIIVGATVG